MTTQPPPPLLQGEPTPAALSTLITFLADVIEATCVIRVVQSPKQEPRTENREEAA